MVGSEALQSGLNRPGSASGSIRSVNQRLSSNSNLIVLMDSDLNVDRSRSSLKSSGVRQIGLDSSGYINAYGWSLPVSSVKCLTRSATTPDQSNPKRPILGMDPSQASDSNINFNKLSGIQVPIPQCCRPLTGDSLGMKIWCATAIDLSGGDLTKISSAKDAAQAPVLSSASSSETSQRTPTNQLSFTSDPTEFHGYVDSFGSMVNISTSTPKKMNNQQALRMLEMEVDKALQEPRDSDSLFEEGRDLGTQSRLPILKGSSEIILNALPVADEFEELSTCVWICSTKHSRSKITIIDIKTKPNELLDSFYVPTFLYCIKSVPGCKPSDLLGLRIDSSSDDMASDQESQTKRSAVLMQIQELINNQKKEFYRLVRVDLETESKFRQSRLTGAQSQGSNGEEDEESRLDRKSRKSSTIDDDEEISRILDNNVSAGIATLQKLNDFVAHSQPESAAKRKSSTSSDTARPATGTTSTSISDRTPKDPTYYQPISTHLSTVWMGGKNSVLYIHSAIGQWKDCVACIKLPDSILQICHFRGRVFVALADGSLCVFFRNVDTKQWEISNYLLIDINLLAEVTNDNMSDLLMNDSSITDRFCTPTRDPTGHFSEVANIQPDQDTTNQASPTQTKPPRSTPTRSKTAGIRCLEIANKNLWVGYRNRIIIIDPVTLKLRHSFNVVPQVDNQIRQLVAMRDGVFCCLRSDLILRLYSSLKHYQHIQNIDIEPVVSRLISPRTFVISHITAMKVAGNTLWIGNAHGIILTIPCKLLPQISEASTSRGLQDLEDSSSSLSIARSVPKCDINNAQVSIRYMW